jgi:DNA gyrase/topoisomerase IV subunit A
MSNPVPRDPAADQLNILAAVALYQSNPHEILDIVLAAETNDEAVAALMEAYGVDKPGAIAILDVQLRRMTGKERARIAAYIAERRPPVAE